MKADGDLSIADRGVIANYAARSSSILEFGVGASTIIISYQRPVGSLFITIDTDMSWIERTKIQVAETCGDRRGPHFFTWDQWIQEPKTDNVYDMIFCDGVDHLRRKFMVDSWGMLKVGGVLLAHDNRRLPDMDNTLALVREFYLEVDSVLVNTENSNISVIKKKLKAPYFNWQKTEAVEQS